MFQIAGGILLALFFICAFALLFVILNDWADDRAKRAAEREAAEVRAYRKALDKRLGY